MQSQFLWSANMQNSNKIIIEDNDKNDKTELLINHVQRI